MVVTAGGLTVLDDRTSVDTLAASSSAAGFTSTFLSGESLDREAMIVVARPEVSPGYLLLVVGRSKNARWCCAVQAQAEWPAGTRTTC